ncbi:two component transcriptional regulator [Actinoplanes friuliensis DSM 7358]|uniref:Two component transcriptional regulator n=1 Tax=Actinoplanes friuliensis DSM 7358 TaxID=1246995 RepID=U5W1D8_9ACTN|nr:two component transcriptional regulator [Actinoplanes friuliensis DSM 7358]
MVDDQPTVVDMLASVLTFHGFAVDTARTGEQAVEKAAEHSPDLVLLDTMLPDGDGLDVCRRLRAGGSAMGIMFLTAPDASADLIAGLAYGDEDWITKPFDVEVLLTRVRALLSRSGSPSGDRLLRYADVELDQDTHEARRGGEVVPLSRTELEVLRYFLQNSGRVLSRGQIEAATASPDVDADVTSLRTELDRLGAPLIVTHRGFGYALRAGLP